MFKKIAALIAVLATLTLGGIGFTGAASATECSNSYTTTWDGAGGFTATPTGTMCSDVTLSVSSYVLPSGWDGTSTFNASSTPQVEFAFAPLVLKANSSSKVSVTVALPNCYGYQADLYTGPEQKKVDYPGGNVGFLKGGLVKKDSCVPAPCVASGSWATEDTAPVQQADGLLFAGPSVPAVDWYHPLSGNLAGIVPSSITYSAVGGYHASLVFEINRFGNSGYATINAEPYLNGFASGQAGTFTVDQNTKVWTSKITSGPGSQSQPITLAAMGALYPNNTLLSEGIHLGTNSVQGQSSLVTKVTGCVTDNFVPVVVPPKPQGSVVVNTVSGAPFCAANGTSTITSVTTTTTTTYTLVDNVWIPKVTSTTSSSVSAPVTNAACPAGPEKGGAPPVTKAPVKVPVVIDSGL